MQISADIPPKAGMYSPHMRGASPGVRLIVNADDFGLTPGVNRAIGELAAAGAVTSATLMAEGDAFQGAAEQAAAQPGLSVGCHVVLVDGRPSARSGISTLVGEYGRFHESLTRFSMELHAGRIAEEEIEREAEAQIRHLQSAGVHVTHVDTHKHTHMFPRVARPLLRAAVRCGLTAVRNPFEPPWSARLARAAPLRRLQVEVLRRFQASFEQLCQEFGVRTTDGAIGVAATGTLDAGGLRCLLQELPPGTWELVCHPGYHDAALDAVKTRLRGARDVEREALLTEITEAVRNGRMQAVSFSDV